MNQHISPSAFPHRVLFTVSGLTPQIVTETIYALAIAGTPHFVPTRLVIMTTRQGAHRVRLLLMGTAPGWLARLCADHGLPDIECRDDDVRVIADATGAPLEDIRTEADNRSAADAIVRTVSELTSDAETALHVSVAGGRKTMGFFAGYALSLYGRAQDRLSHVLVPPEFEGHDEFYYPTPYRKVITTRNGPRDTATAVISIADLPFVRMRDGLSEPLRTGRVTYAEAVAEVQGNIAPPALVIDLAQRKIVAGRTTMALPPAQLALYAWMARRAKARLPWLVKTGKCLAAQELEHAEAYLSDYRAIKHDQNLEVPVLSHGMKLGFFSPKLAELNRMLEQGISDPRPDRYMVQRAGTRPQWSYGLALDSDQITIVS